MNEKKNIKELFKVTPTEVKELFRIKRSKKSKAGLLVFMIGVIFTPITLIGALIGYARAYKRFMFPIKMFPVFDPILPIARVAMLAGAILIWVALYLLTVLIFKVIGFDYQNFIYLICYLGINIILSFFVFAFFNRWRAGYNNYLVEGRKFGSARLAREDELQEYIGKEGIYIGGGYTFSDRGHILTVAGTRGGKGTNLIIPNLLGLGNYQGSWVVIDPKGENAAITARRQVSLGQKVVILNPWHLHPRELGRPMSYNPLDILADKTSINLVDDVQIIAEMIIPIDKGDRDKFFSDTARAIIAGLILYLVVTQPKEKRTLATIWNWVRFSVDEWDILIGDMSAVDEDDKINSPIIKNSANEIEKLMKAGDKVWGSVIATILQNTDFLKSTALQQSLQSDFDPRQLTKGNVTLYIIIPADKMQSHARWLRLVTTTAMRAVVRNPDKRVTFLLDEFAALGYISEIEVAMGAYAGFNLTVWPILQSLSQLKKYYSETWETFIGNTAVKHYFSIADHFTAEYISKTMGVASHVIYQRGALGIQNPRATQRQLFTPDEIMQGSVENIFAFIGGKHPTYFRKRPYYEMPFFVVDGMPIYDENPYFK